MSELVAIIEDDDTIDPPTLRSLRSEIERWLRVLGVPTRCECGCGEPHSGLNMACSMLLGLCQEPVEPASALMGMEDEEDEDPFVILAEQQEWPDMLWDISADWIDEFEGMEPQAHPVRRGGFRWALDQMLVNDFVFDLRSQVETQIARHERRDIEAKQLDLFPEA